MQPYIRLLEKSSRSNNVFPFYIYSLSSRAFETFVPPHWHEELEILYCSGSGTCELDGAPISYEAGDIIFVNSEVMHSYKANSASQYFAIVFHYNFLDFSKRDYFQSALIDKLKSRQLEFPRKVDSKNEIHPKLCLLIREIIDLYHSDILGREINIKCNLYLMLSLLFKYNKFIDSKSIHRPYKSATLGYVKNAIEYIENNYSSNITMDDLAKNANVNKYYLIKIFKQLVGVPPIEYLINFRIECAAELLKDNFSVTQICHEVGFNNISYFISKFKYKYSVTPKEFHKTTL